MMNEECTIFSDFGFTPFPYTIMASNVCAVTETCETIVAYMYVVYSYTAGLGGAGQLVLGIPNRVQDFQFVATQIIMSTQSLPDHGH